MRAAASSPAAKSLEEALRLLEQQEIDRETDLQQLRARMDQTLAEADRGVVVDREEFMQRMLDELDAKKAQRKADCSALRLAAPATCADGDGSR